MRPTLPRPILPITALSGCALFVATLLGCDQNPNLEQAACEAPAVVVQVDGDRWCAHHDVARFTCPAELPNRHTYQGVAFCGSRVVDDSLADPIARAALRTGEVLERRDVLGFDVPAPWRAAPGALSDTPLDIAVRTFTASNMSWSSSDGDATLCTRRFERFEVEADGAGGLRITGWDRLRCGPEEVGMGAELNETLPLTLPGLPPGRHRLDGIAASRQPTPAALLVDLDALCLTQPIEACFRGAFFADCGGAEGLEPAIWCDPEAYHQCIWAECPPAGFTARACGDDIYCPNPHIGWGPEPWSRTRGMVLDVAVDGALADEPPRVECIDDAEEWRDRICHPAPDAWIVERSPDDEGWGWPSLMRLQAWPQDRDQNEGWGLMVEVDVFAEGGPQARACLVPYSDGGTSSETVCAEAGHVTLDRLPEAVEDIPTIRATVHAELPDFERDPLCAGPCITRGLVIDARL